MSAEPASYRRVQDEILRRVRTREWPPGAMIPGEVTLAAEFGCARATMNRALSGLAEAGVLERKRRAGTRVALNPVRRATLCIPLVREEVEAMGGRYGYRLLARRETPLPPEWRDRLGPQKGAFVHLSGLHLKDDAPFQYEERWINPRAVPAVRRARFDTLSPNEWLVRETPFSEGDIALLAVGADPRIAKRLEVAAGAPLFVLERVTWLGSRPITAVRMAYPPGYRLVSRL